jgi:hypothetical protein
MQEWKGGEFAELERELKQAMRRVDPPAGFADRVMARIEKPAEQKRAKVLMMPVRWRPWLSGALAAGLAIGVFAVQEVRVHQQEKEQQRKAEMAQQQFEMAVQITNETLNDVRQQIRQAGIPVGD